MERIHRFPASFVAEYSSLESIFIQVRLIYNSRTNIFITHIIQLLAGPALLLHSITLSAPVYPSAKLARPFQTPRNYWLVQLLDPIHSEYISYREEH